MGHFLKYFVVVLLSQIVGVGLLILLIELTGSEILWNLFLTVFVRPSAFILRILGGAGETDITLPALVLIIFYSVVLASLWFLKSKLGSRSSA